MNLSSIKDKPKGMKGYIWYSMNLASILYFVLQLIISLLVLDFNHSWNPILWTTTGKIFSGTILSWLIKTSPISLVGNHFLSLLFINIAFWFVLYKFNFHPFWVGVIIFWGISIHETLWLANDIIWYHIHNIYFDYRWVMGYWVEMVQLIIMIFIFPWKFKMRQKKVLYFFICDIIIYIGWELIGFPVSYEYTRFEFVNNPYVHFLEEIIWGLILSLLIYFQPFEEVISSPNKGKLRARIKAWRENQNRIV